MTVWEYWRQGGAGGRGFLGTLLWRLIFEVVFVGWGIWEWKAWILECVSAVWLSLFVDLGENSAGLGFQE